MKYVIAMDAILRGHVSPTEYEGIFFWRNDNGFRLTRHVAVAAQYETRKEAEDAMASQNISASMKFSMYIRKDPYIMALSEQELFKLALKDPKVNIGLD